MNCGFAQPGRPSLGSWVTYALGSESADLPAFVVMSTGSGISGGAACWSSGFLPGAHTGTRFRNSGPPILDVAPPAGTDAAVAAETLVVWGGEFGRTPMVEASAVLGRSQGRDHHPNAFTMWLAGGGIRGGVTHGETDDFGFHVVRDEVHVHDLQATILHCLGLDHERLTFRHQGRDFRLTDVHGRVASGILA
jgi:hypothetical protein